MPLVRIDLSDRRSPQQRREISDGVHRAFVEAVGIPEDDRFHLLTTHPAEEIIADPHFLGVERQDVVYIQTTLVRGRTTATKRSLYRAIVTNLEQVGVRKEDVTVFLAENGREDISVGNGEAQLLASPGPGAAGDTTDDPDS